MTQADELRALLKSGEKLSVARKGYYNKTLKTISGDWLEVNGVRICEHVKALADAGYARAKASNPENPALHMRPMFYTCSPFGLELVELALIATQESAE